MGRGVSGGGGGGEWVEGVSRKGREGGRKGE